MAQNNSSKLEAIQVVLSHSKDEQQVIEVIEKYENGPLLHDVLCGENKELPIFVISICGKTRTGKSFLLNLMIKYLESKGFEDWADGVLPSVFEWKSGTESVTRGLWICPKIFKRRNQHGKEVGILLLDNQGLFDGEQTDGVSMAVSGISTSLSCYQIFNLKDSICENDLESIWRHLISDDRNLSDASGTKLVFTVRDYLGEDSGCGLDHGKAYIEADMNRGSQAHKDMWEGLRKTFPEIICLLLPFPGNNVRKGEVKYMKDIEPEFLKEVEKFFSKMFEPKYLNDTKNASRGQQIYETLKKFDGKVADESLSFANVFTEQGNENKLEFLMRNFDSRIESLEHNPSSGQSLIETFLTMAKQRFKGKSSGDYLVKLETFMTQKINLTLKNLILTRYESSLQQSTSASYTHSLEYESVKKRLGYFVGSEAEKNELKEKVIEGCADLYYNNLRKELLPRFESYCEHKTLVGLEGFDEDFVSNEFTENDDFMVKQTATRVACKAIWLREKVKLRDYVQDKLLTYVAALTDFDKEWLKKATQTQFKFYEVFCWNESHWIKIERHDNSLEELIGYTMYKKAQKRCEYSEDQLKAITRIDGQIRSQSGVSNQITLSCIFILYRHGENESCEPLYKVQNQSRCTFVDIKGRAYSTWEDYGNDNELPDCLYCHPSEGKYDKKQGFRVAFKWSPASSFGSKLLKVLDVAGKVVAIGSAGALGAVVAFPAATVAAIGGAVAAGVSGSYGIIRSIFKITDKVKHDEAVEALDVVEIVANGLSVATAGATAGAVLMTTIGRELACAPAVIQSISSLTNLAFQLDRENVSYLSLANDMSMFLLFNSKSIEGSINNIRTSYSLPPETTMLDTLRDFISKNSITFPKMNGERLTTEQFFSENLKSLLVTAIMNKFEERPLQFIKDVATSENLRPLQNLFGRASHEEQVQFFEELIKLIGKIIPNKRNTNSRGLSYQGTGYRPTTGAKSDVALAGVCTGLTSISECPFDECIQQICFVAKEILKLINENAETTDLEGPIAYLQNNGNEVVKKVVEVF